MIILDSLWFLIYMAPIARPLFYLLIIVDIGAPVYLFYYGCHIMEKLEQENRFLEERLKEPKPYDTFTDSEIRLLVDSLLRVKLHYSFSRWNVLPNCKLQDFLREKGSIIVTLSNSGRKIEVIVDLKNDEISYEEPEEAPLLKGKEVRETE